VQMSHSVSFVHFCNAYNKANKGMLMDEQNFEHWRSATYCIATSL